MKAIKRAFYGSIALGTSGLFVLGSFNSFDISSRKIRLKNDFNIQFAKRIDDMTGEVIVGRMAASIPKYNPFMAKQKELAKSKQVPTSVSIVEKKFKEDQTSDSPVIDIAEIPEATVQEVPGAVLVAGMYNKTPLKNIPQGAGEVSVSNGVISDLSVSFPDGRVFNPVFSRDEMVGNVFEYEDTGTSEVKSGLMYEIAQGHYMVTFTDDSVFNTVRLEFKTALAMKKPVKNIAWDMNEQNQTDQSTKVIGDYSKVEKSEEETENESYEADAEDFINDDMESFQNSDDSDFAQGEEDKEPIAELKTAKQKTYAFVF